MPDDDWKPEVCGYCHQDIRGNSITLRGSTYYHAECARHQTERITLEYAPAWISAPPVAGEG